MVLADKKHPPNGIQGVKVPFQFLVMPRKKTLILPVCATCLATTSNGKNGYCKNNHDNWVEARDLEHADVRDRKGKYPEFSDTEMLYQHSKQLAKRMGITMKELLAMPRKNLGPNHNGR